MAGEANFNPKSLYNLAIAKINQQHPVYRDAVKLLPDNILFDIYQKMFDENQLCHLAKAYSDLDVFEKMLRVRDKRLVLHRCFQGIMDHPGGMAAKQLALAYEKRCKRIRTDTSREKNMLLGISLAGFLTEAGWYSTAGMVYAACHVLVRRSKNMRARVTRLIECGVRLMHVKTLDCQYREATALCENIMEDVRTAEEGGHEYNRALLQSEMCLLNYSQSLYDPAYENCVKALEALRSQRLDAHTILDVFCICSKVYVIKRDFRKAGMLIKYAVFLARERFGPDHLKFADVLIDYGNFLLNADEIHQAQKVHLAVLDIRKKVFGGNNLHVAIAHEDLAYCSYVFEYGSGKFSPARKHAENAISIIRRILPQNHLLLAAAKRVKALILEEIAVDSPDKAKQEKLLREAQQLHLSSLKLSLEAFGEENVQVSKHFGNLGRLYQSMKNYEVAEEMHIKAISIKERLLGHDDYEVALSVGHLASLYNYDLRKYDQAEQLYLRSIRIGMRLFGDGYSGLEYDYRGLIELYQRTGQADKQQEFRDKLLEWRAKRDQAREEVKEPLEVNEYNDVSEVFQEFAKAAQEEREKAAAAEKTQGSAAGKVTTSAAASESAAASTSGTSQASTSAAAAADGKRSPTWAAVAETVAMAAESMMAEQKAEEEMS